MILVWKVVVTKVPGVLLVQGCNQVVLVPCDFFTFMDSKLAAEGSLVGVFSTIKNIFSPKDVVRLLSVGGFENVTFSL